MKKEIISFLRLFIFMFSGAIAILLTLWIEKGWELYEPDILIARIEMTMFLIIAIISGSLAYFEVKSQR